MHSTLSDHVSHSRTSPWIPLYILQLNSTGSLQTSSKIFLKVPWEPHRAESDVSLDLLCRIEVYAASQQIRIGRLVVSYHQNTKHQVVYVAVICCLVLRTFLQFSPSNSYAYGLIFYQMTQFPGVSWALCLYLVLWVHRSRLVILGNVTSKQQTALSEFRN